MRGKVSVISKEVVSCLLVVCFISGFTTRALSQDYPTKAITMVVGIDPGGMIDVATRVLAEEMKKILKQDVLVENKPGASHLVALSYVLTTKPDGYTLFSSTDSPFVRVPHMLKVKFDPISETVPIIFYGIFTHFVFAGKGRVESWPSGRELYLQLSLISRVEDWRGTRYLPVSSPRLVKPGVRISRTGLSCPLHLKG